MRHNEPVQTGTKVCISCGATKPVAEFYPHRTMADGRLGKCRTCTQAHTERWRQDNRSRVNATRHRSRAKRVHPLTDQQYDDLYQDARCAGCGTADDPIGKRLAIDHDHSTGAVRGLLCIKCNLTVGTAGDDPALLRRLAAYLESWR